MTFFNKIYMKYEFQKSNRDCFPTCLLNAFRHFSIKISEPVKTRLSILDHGTENCSLVGAIENSPKYQNSKYKLINEFRINIEPEQWVKDLREQGVMLEFYTAPIEKEKILLEKLSNHAIIVCDVAIPSRKNLCSDSRHSVLILEAKSDKLLIHDPLKENVENVSKMENRYEYFQKNCCSGRNLEVKFNHFFSDNDKDFFKPRVNPNNCECGYSFIAVVKSRAM
jgi:hypothetical protein